MTSFEVAVVGFGVMGASVTWSVSRRGANVLAIERGSLGHAEGSSHGRTRILRTAYAEGPEYVPLVLRAKELWEDLGRAASTEVIRTTGGLVLGAPGSTLVEGAQRSAQLHGLPYERLNAGEVHSRFPIFRPRAEEVALYDPAAASILVEPGLDALLRTSLEAGAHVSAREPMIGWTETAEEIVLRTVHGSYRTGHLVICAGPWLPRVVPALGVPLQVERQVVFWFDPGSAGADAETGKMPVFTWQVRPGSYFYGVPNFGDGPKVAGDEGTGVDSPDEVDRSVSLRDREPVIRFLRDRLPRLDGPERLAVTCLYTNSPDRHFLIDRLPGSRRAWVVSACSGHGFKFGPAIGEAIAQWILDGRSRLDLDPFRIGRPSLAAGELRQRD